MIGSGNLNNLIDVLYMHIYIYMIHDIIQYHINILGAGKFQKVTGKSLGFMG